MKNAHLGDSGTSSLIPIRQWCALDVDLVIASWGHIVDTDEGVSFIELGSRFKLYNGEFDPGSERTLAAWIRHASRTRKLPSGSEYSGGRVSNAWETCL